MNYIEIGAGACTILTTLLAGIWRILNRIKKNKASLFQKLDEIQKKTDASLDEIQKKMDSNHIEIKKELNKLDSRLSRLEGRFEERGYWESRDKRIGE